MNYQSKNSLLKPYLVFLTYLLILFLLPGLIIEVSIPIKLLLTISFVFLLNKAIEIINILAEIIHIKQRISDTNEAIKMFCVTFFYGMSYFFVNSF
jgi:hypothetical protein